jgi:hypothetical protein
MNIRACGSHFTDKQTDTELNIFTENNVKINRAGQPPSYGFRESTKPPENIVHCVTVYNNYSLF